MAGKIKWICGKWWTQFRKNNKVLEHFLFKYLGLLKFTTDQKLYDYVLELNWRSHEGWRSRAADSVESWRPLRTTHSVILRGLPVHGWVAVIPNHFHFVIIPPTSDCGILSSGKISRLDLLNQSPFTEQHWNSLSYWKWPIVSQLLVEAVWMFDFEHVAMEVNRTLEFNDLDGWVNTFECNVALITSDDS